MTLMRPVGITLPGADATISIRLKQAHAKARQNIPIIAKTIARPIGDGGVSIISSAAGRNANSSRSRTAGTPAAFGALSDFMASLNTVERSIAPRSSDQFIVRAVLDETSTFQGDDAVRVPHSR